MPGARVLLTGFLRWGTAFPGGAIYGASTSNATPTAATQGTHRGACVHRYQTYPPHDWEMLNPNITKFRPASVVDVDGVLYNAGVITIHATATEPQETLITARIGKFTPIGSA